MKLVAIILACLSLFFAGLDAALTTVSFWYRDSSAWLFVATWLLWAAVAAAAWLPIYGAWAVLGRFRPRSERGDRRDAVVLCFVVLGSPVISHSGLNAFLPMGAGIADIFSPLPLLCGLLCFVVSVAIAVWLGQVARLKGLGFLGVLAGAGLLMGMFNFSGAESEDPVTVKAPSDAPNLLLMVWDTTRAASLDLYGNERATAPLLAASAGNMAVFEEARSTAVFTLTSHLSMLTGTYPSHHGARLTKQSYNPVETPSMARLLREAGYRTGAFVGTAVLNGNTGVGEGFEVFDDRVDPDVCKTKVWSMIHDVQSFLAALAPQFGGNGRPHWFETFDRPAQDVLANALEWIENGDSRPWFCMVNMYDVHWPYLPTSAAASRFVQPYDGAVDGYLFRSNAYRRNEAFPGESLEDEDRQYIVDLYESEIFELDGKVDEFWKEVTASSKSGGREMGAVITADHGEAFGEDSTFGHGDVLEVQVRVPFLLQSPGVGANGSRPGKVSSVDIAPTLLAFAGIERPGWMVGLDLSVSTPSENRIILVEDRDHLGAANSQHALYRGDWKLLVHGFAADGEVELFDLRSDELGVEDVSNSYAEVVEELQAALMDLRASWGADGGEKAWVEGSAGIADHLQALGYGGD